jgi:hypothetical protein
LKEREDRTKSIVMKEWLDTIEREGNKRRKSQSVSKNERKAAIDKET